MAAHLKQRLSKLRLVPTTPLQRIVGAPEHIRLHRVHRYRRRPLREGYPDTS